MYIDDRRVESRQVFASNLYQGIDLPLPTAIPTVSVAKVLFEGVTQSGLRLSNLKWSLLIPPELVVMNPGGLPIDFVTATNVESLSIVNRSAPNDGWGVATPFFQVGYQPEYENDVNTDAVLAQDLSALNAAQLNLIWNTTLPFMEIGLRRPMLHLRSTSVLRGLCVLPRLR